MTLRSEANDVRYRVDQVRQPRGFFLPANYFDSSVIATNQDCSATWSARRSLKRTSCRDTSMGTALLVRKFQDSFKIDPPQSAISECDVACLRRGAARRILEPSSFRRVARRGDDSLTQAVRRSA